MQRWRCKGLDHLAKGGAEHGMVRISSCASPRSPQLREWIPGLLGTAFRMQVGSREARLSQDRTWGQRWAPTHRSSPWLGPVKGSHYHGPHLHLLAILWLSLLIDQNSEAMERALLCRKYDEGSRTFLLFFLSPFPCLVREEGPKKGGSVSSIDSPVGSINMRCMSGHI
ncbi:hypothetical protein BGZ63DRAFT_220317 [Mariannaea sp. PMI_226]|nr:hypothetical protein BGZ63DRAFT_220317 [Mariannaea sp. PMI_226]